MPDNDSDLPLLDKIELNGFSLDVDKFLKRDYDDISSASQELPALIEWINMLVQIYLERRIVAKQEIKETEAAAYIRFLKDGTVEKKTDSYISKLVDIDDDVKKAHRKYARLAGWVSRLQNLQNSFQSKLDLVRSTESTRRALVDQQPDEPS
jgi:hypothetical protein